MSRKSNTALRQRNERHRSPADIGWQEQLRQKAIELEEDGYADKVILSPQNDTSEVIDTTDAQGTTGDAVDADAAVDPAESSEPEPVVDPDAEKAAAKAAAANEMKFVRDEAAERLMLHLPELDEKIEAAKADLAARNEKRKAAGLEEIRFSVRPVVRDMLRDKNIIPDELLRDKNEVPPHELVAILQTARSLDRQNQKRIRARNTNQTPQQTGSRKGTPAPKRGDRATPQSGTPKPASQPKQPEQQAQSTTTQPVDPDAGLSDEYKAKRAAAKAQYDRNQSIADLVTVDSVGGVHVPKGSGKVAGRYVSENEASLLAAFQDDIRDSVTDRQKENELFERSKKLAPAVGDIEAALAAAQDAIQNGTQTEAEVIRAALVAAKVYGDDTARIIGNITDNDEIISLYSYAKGGNAATATLASTPSTGAPLVAPQIPTGAPTTTSQGSGQPLVAPQIPTTGTPPQGSGQPLVAPQIPTPATPTTPPQGSGQPLVAPQIPLPQTTPNTPPANPNALTPAQELLEKKFELEEARTEWAKYSAKRHRRVIFGMFLRRSSKYQAAQERYQNLSREVAKRELADTLANIDQDPALTTDEQRITQKRATVDAHWITEQNQLREEATQFVEDRTWWRVVNGVSNWMNKGGKVKRFAKRATLGLAAGVAGALTFGAGTAGAAAALMAFRFGNSQIRQTTGGIGKLSTEQETELKSGRMTLRARTSDDILENRANAFMNTYENDGDKQRTKRMIAIGKSAAVAAAGAGVGLAAHAAYEATSSWIGGMGDHAAAAGSGPRVEGKPGSGGGAGGGGGTGGAEVMTAPAGHDLLNPTGAYYVRPGEGWYETFQDMGIPQDNWANVLQDAGPKLRDLGVANFNTASNQWWISQSGNLSPDALRTIADSSAKFGYTFNKF